MDDLEYKDIMDLHDHCRAFLVALMKSNIDISWRSKKNHPDDRPMRDGYFIVGINKPNGLLTCYYEIEYWKDFSGIPEIPHAYKQNGSTEITNQKLLNW